MYLKEQMRGNNSPFKNNKYDKHLNNFSGSKLQIETDSMWNKSINNHHRNDQMLNTVDDMFSQLPHVNIP